MATPVGTLLCLGMLGLSLTVLCIAAILTACVGNEVALDEPELRIFTRNPHSIRAGRPAAATVI